MESDVSKQAIGRLVEDINNLPEESISVREKWRQKRAVCRREVLHQFGPATVSYLSA
jgi:type I restriction enzyme, R subunit